MTTVEDQKKIQQIKLMLNGLAEYYGVTLTPSQLAMYSEDLFILKIEELCNAIKYVRSSEQFFPKPGVILKFVRGDLNEAAVEIANKILEALSTYGWNNPEKAKSFLGPYAWKIIQSNGGWENMCQNTTNENIPMLRAQWREHAKSIISQVKSGRISVAQLENNKTKQLASLAESEDNE